MTIPPPAYEILTLIRVTETGRADATAYDTIYSGTTKTHLSKPITAMTVDELQSHQPGFTKSFGSSASGAYQFMLATLRDLETKLGLSGSEIFNPELQDRLGYELLKRRGFQPWLDGKTTTDTLMVGLAKEWASFPVPSRMKGAHRTVERGQTYYAGDGLNKALIGPDVVWLACEAARGVTAIDAEAGAGAQAGRADRQRAGTDARAMGLCLDDDFQGAFQPGGARGFRQRA